MLTHVPASPPRANSLCPAGQSSRTLHSCCHPPAPLLLLLRCFLLSPSPPRCLTARLQSSTQSHSAIEAENESPNYPGIVESTNEYKFVERLIPPTRIPSPPKYKDVTPSGWKPPSDSPPDLPYFVRRSRMHNIPVYTDLARITRKLTIIRRIDGDIWALERDVKEYLTQILGKTPLTQVHEITRSIRVKGFYEQELKSWLLEKGF